jgi:8-oxo-dGTP pyrophosphatase MutT (NUDIX family)
VSNPADNVGGVGTGDPSALALRDQVGQVVRAAGGLVVRRSSGLLQIAIVHRPGRVDWSFPKGKLEPGEDFVGCALREVCEETGLRCRIVRFVGHTRYRDRKDRPKVVAYWAMEVVAGTFVVNDEVDELRWLSVEEALALLTYERDRELLAVLVAAEETHALVS